MPTLDKNQAVIDFLMECPVIAKNPLFFNFVDAEDDNKQIVTQANETTLDRKFVDGSILKRYTFSIMDFRSITYQPIPKSSGISNENVEELLDVQSIIDWVEEQAEIHNYPNFGSGYLIDDMHTTSNNPNLAGVDTQMTPALAKYSLSIQIDYIDKTKTLWN